MKYEWFHDDESYTELLLASGVFGFPILLYRPINPVIQASLRTCIKVLEVESALHLTASIPPLMNSARLVLVGDSETSDRRAISKIPSEAWTEIFKWTLDGQPPFDISQTQEGPWLLGRICSWLRALVVSRSPIWTNFKLDVPHPSPTRVTVPSAQSYGHLLRSVLDRSGGLPLSFALSIRDISTGNLLLPILVKELKRWKSACITAPRAILGLITTDKSSLNMACSQTAGIAEALELIGLLDFPDSRGLWVRSGEVFRDAPRLRSARLLGVLTPGIPWGQLINLCIGKVKFSDVLGILPCCQKLKRLRLLKGLITDAELADSSSDSEDPAAACPDPEEKDPTPEEGSLVVRMDGSKITLADLKVVQLFDPKILSYLHAPSSEVLTIETTLVLDLEATLNNSTTLFNFLTSCSRIQVLDVVISGSDANSLAKLFPLMPEIQDLRVKVCSKNDRFQGGADHLLDSLETGLPTLKKFTSDGEGALFSEEKLRDVLETRKANGCGLSRVDISSSISIASDD
ncbi:hypothetical protein IW261DRAFT_1573743 [Armillaria novae-zelandiae]|uniref:F-box domain-containing protein n=1 Tax=Armillaria novae-zelandiae TaxID=153914 RepID=A0AA39NMX8_9AGAR|nr:hypothetical protein IW261DRAFT_1573743 [Armillaria novae-zelandiae]